MSPVPFTYVHCYTHYIFHQGMWSPLPRPELWKGSFNKPEGINSHNNFTIAGTSVVPLVSWVQDRSVLENTIDEEIL